VVKKGHRTSVRDVPPLSSAAFEILSQIDLRQLKDFQKTDFLTYVKDREVKEKEVIVYKDVKLMVSSTHPYGAGKITEDTSIEVLFRPTVISSDIIFAINTSYSMKFKDFKPSRYAAIISILQRFLEKRLEYDFNDRVGIISFNHDWAQVSELHQITQNYIDDVIEGLRRTKLQGHASIGSAISGAMNVFKLEGDRKRARILVLITDTTEDAFGNPIEKAKSVGNNIVIYPLVIGTSETQEANIAAEIAGATNGKAYRLITQEKLEMMFLDMADHFRIVPNYNTAFDAGIYSEVPGKTEQRRHIKEITKAQQRTKRGDAESIIMVGNNAANDVLARRARDDDEAKDESITIKALKKIKRALWD
jgi:Mg-chelatase subunit ChlD